MPSQKPESFYEELIDAVNGMFGAYPGHRAAHAKGMYAKGTFSPTAAASRLSRAAHFQAGPIPVLARFSNGSGVPDSSDFDPDPRGLALKFTLPDGKTTDLVTITLPAFFTRTAVDFLEFVRARSRVSKDQPPDPARVAAFVAKHPETKRVLDMMIKAKPVTSFATAHYNGIHAYQMTNAEGQQAWCRARLDPVHSVVEDCEATIANVRVDAMQHDLRSRLHAGPVTFSLRYFIADPSDDVNDPTVPWPESRRSVEVGKVELDQIHDAPSGAADTTIFDPTNVTDGIGLSDDDVLHARRGAYGVSYARRTAVR